MPRSIVLHPLLVSVLVSFVLEVAQAVTTTTCFDTHVCSSLPPTSLVHLFAFFLLPLALKPRVLLQHTHSFITFHRALTSLLRYDAAYLRLCLVVSSLFYDSDKTGLCVLIESYRFVCACVSVYASVWKEPYPSLALSLSLILLRLLDSVGNSALRQNGSLPLRSNQRSDKCSP